MTTDENKAIVRRFIKEVLGNGNIDLIDQLLAPEYKNLSMGVTNRAGFKAVVSSLKVSIPNRDFEIMDLIAEGDSVVFRGNMNVILANGRKVSARDITYYRLVNGKIVEDEPMSSPPLTELLASMIPPKPST
jgi:predicted SnoaL-like aldol condensation-catalyzing enzyme